MNPFIDTNPYTNQKLVGIDTNKNLHEYNAADVVNAYIISNNVVVTTSSNYIVLPNDYYIVVKKVTGSASTVNLPVNPIIGKTYIIKDGKGDASINNITVLSTGGVTIDGATSKIINANYGICKVFYTGTEYFLIN